MRFLADESCDSAIVKALRQAGYDVLAVSEISPGIRDQDVMELARTDSRILLTEDKDFGQLVYAGAGRSHGVVLFRVPTGARKWFVGTLVRLIEQNAERLVGRFCVMQPGRVRISEHPDTG